MNPTTNKSQQPLLPTPSQNTITPQQPNPQQAPRQQPTIQNSSSSSSSTPTAYHHQTNNLQKSSVSSSTSTSQQNTPPSSTSTVQQVTPAQTQQQSTGGGYNHNVGQTQHQQAAPPQQPAPPPGHSFLSAVSEVKNMENALLGLLTAFNSGELSAFGSGRTLETMEAIRSKQERLARLHFDLASGINLNAPEHGDQDRNKDQQQQQQPPPTKPQSQSPQQQSPQQQQQATQPDPQNTTTSSSSTSPWMSESDQNKLVAGLRELSVEIEKLHEHESEERVVGGGGSIGSTGRGSKSGGGLMIIPDHEVVVGKDGSEKQ